MIEKLKDELIKGNYSIVADINGSLYTSNYNGIKPLTFMMKDNKEFFKDAVVADKVIGKAAAMLLTLSGAKEIYGEVMSKSAAAFLEKKQIKYSYDNLVDYIENRTRDGMCPMEQTVKDIDDLEEGYAALLKKIAELMSQKK